MTSEVTTTQFERSIEMFTGDPAKMWLFPQNANSHTKKKLEERDSCYWNWQHLVKF